MVKRSKKNRSDVVLVARSDLEALRAAARPAEEYKDLSQRARADFLNFQERGKREKEDWSRYMLSDFVREFLPALDSLAESENHLRQAKQTAEVLDGLKILYKEFLCANVLLIHNLGEHA